jgi:hypothetical protein
MTLIDILTYSNVPTGENPANLPLDWPYQTKYIYEDTQPISEGWIRLTEQDYNNYITDEDRVARCAITGVNLLVIKNTLWFYY